MGSLTRSKIAYDLNVSPHETTLHYKGSEIRYIFSSNLYKKNFINKIGEHRSKINDSLSNRFGFTIRNDILADIKLYNTIEKRGFLIYHDGEKIECLNGLILDGQNLTIRT